MSKCIHFRVDICRLHGKIKPDYNALVHVASEEGLNSMILKALQSSNRRMTIWAWKEACSVFGKSDTRGSIVVLVDIDSNSLTVL